MGVIPDRTDFKNCGREDAERFFSALLGMDGLHKVTYHAPTEASHFERYGYVYCGKKVTVVYDLKAKMLTVTSFEDATPQFTALFDRIGRSNAADKVPPVSASPAQLPQVKTPTKAQQPPKAAAPNAQQPQKAAAPSKAQQPPKAAAQGKTPTQKQQPPKTAAQAKAQQPPKAAAQGNAPTATPPPPPDPTENPGGLTVKKYTQERYAGLIKKLAKEKSCKIKEEAVFDAGKPTEIRTSVVTNGDNQKIKLRFMPKKQLVQLQGKQGALYSLLQLFVSEATDYKSAVSAHIEMTREDGRRTDVEKQLKKLIPGAIPYLSEQSKIDFTIGMLEILNDTQEHYDYSMFLLPPFRGLERLIIDLQRAQGIDVRMIGQAYEREEGVHVLKASYRRRINSIVYAEVMAALYSEYFVTRNYYAHSDNTDAAAGRVLSKREQAKAVFIKMMRIIDYNCKKLTEIGFILS